MGEHATTMTDDELVAELERRITAAPAGKELSVFAELIEHANPDQREALRIASVKYSFEMALAGEDKQ